MPKLFKSDKGAIAPLIGIVILLLGLGLGVYLVSQKTNLLPKASENGTVVFLDNKEGNFIRNSDNPTVWVRLYKPNLISAQSPSKSLISEVSAQTSLFSLDKCPSTIDSSKYVLGQDMQVGLDIKQISKDFSQENGGFFTNINKDLWNQSFSSISYKAIKVDNQDDFEIINTNNLDSNNYPWRKYWQPKKEGVYDIYATLIDKNNNSTSCPKPLHRMIVLPKPTCTSIEGPSKITGGQSGLYKLNFPQNTQLFSIIEDGAASFAERFSQAPDLKWTYFFSFYTSAYKSGENPPVVGLSGLGVFRNLYRDGNYSLQTEWQSPINNSDACIDVNLRFVLNEDLYGKSATGNWIGLEAYSTDNSKVICEKKVQVAKSDSTSCAGFTSSPAASIVPIGIPKKLIKAKMSDSPGFEKNSVEVLIPEDREYTETQFTFQNQDPGPKFLYVQFIYSDGTSRRGSPYPATIYLTQKASAISSPAITVSPQSSTVLQNQSPTPPKTPCDKDKFDAKTWTVVGKSRCSGKNLVKTYECGGKKKTVKTLDSSCG